MANLFLHYINITFKKVLVHGKDVIDFFPFPIAWFSEEPGEASNKIFKKFRLNHARKHSRIATLTDIIYRMLQLSDPIVLQSRINKNLAFAKKEPFDSDVLELLEPYDPPEINPDTVSSFFD